MKIPTSNRSKHIYRKYHQLAKRFQKSLLSNEIKHKSNLLQRLCRYERQLQRLGIAAGLSMSVLGFSQQVQAQSVPPGGGEFPVNTYITGGQDDTRVAIDASGDFVVVWESYGQDGYGNGVYARRYNKDGTPKGAEFLVNTYTTDEQRDPSIAMDDAGNFVVVWESRYQDGSYFGIYGQRYNSSGIAQGLEFSINTYTLDNQTDPNVAMDSDGDFVVVWESGESNSPMGQNGQDGSYFGIYGQRYNSSGVAQGLEFSINTYTADNQTDPNVAMDDNGNFVVVWESGENNSPMGQNGQDGSYFGIYGRRYDSNGIAQSGEFIINNETQYTQQDPWVAMDSDGNFVVVWESDTQDGSYFGIYGRLYNNSGVAQGSEFPVNTYTTGFQVDPRVAIDSDGDFVVVWQSEGQDGDGYGVYAQAYNSDGTSNGSEFKVNTGTDGNQNDPHIDMDSDGNFVVVWESYGFRQDGDDYGVYSQRYRVKSVINGDEFCINTYKTESQGDPRVAMDSDGDFVVVWESYNQDGQYYGIYGQLYNKDGTTNGGEFQINTYTTEDQDNPDVAMDDAGNFVVVWESDDQDGDRNGVYGRLYDSNGIAQGADFQINTTTADSQDDPNVAMDSNGNFVVVWESYGQDGYGYGDGIYGQRYNSSGLAQGGEFHINNQLTEAQRDPVVAMDDAGNFVVVWESYGQDGDGNGIYGRLYDSNGIAQGVEFKINDYTTNYQQDPYVAMDGDGDFVVVWESGYFAGSGQDGSRLGIYGQAYNSDGTTKGGEFQVNTYTTDYQSDPKVAMDSNGDFVVVWESRPYDPYNDPTTAQDGNYNGVYAQAYDSNCNKEGNEFQVNTFTIDSQDDPAIAIDDLGNVIIVWESSYQDGSYDGVYGKRYDASIPLPVELLSFKGVHTEKGNQLTWLTASETNNEGFSIERSENAKSWKSIGFVRGKGTTIEQQAYAFLDQQISEGLYYYRLKQLDMDGIYEYSEIIVLQSVAVASSLLIMPNPVQDVLQIQLPSKLSETVTFSIIDLNGRLLFEQSAALQAGNNINTFALSHLAVGTYVLKVQSGQRVEQVKFVKL